MFFGEIENDISAELPPKDVLSEEEWEDLLEKFYPEDQTGIRAVLSKLNLSPRALERALGDYEMGIAFLSLRDVPAEKLPKENLDALIPILEILMRNKETLVRAIPASRSPEDFTRAIEEVKSMERPAEAKDPRVKAVLGKLPEELAAYEPQFENRAVAGMLYGSFLFGDPSKKADLDFDFVISSQADAHPLLEKVEGELGDWDEVSMHTTTVNLEEIEESLRSVSRGDYSDFMRTHPIGAFGESINHSLILTGRVIDLPSAQHEEINNRIAEVRGKIIETAKRNLVYRIIMVADLSLILTRRRERRSQ